jgi:hypothetical protein
MEHKLIISPRIKVMQLIEAYPELEEVLIEYVPAFSKLKNPVLRKTVAKIATLQQAATVGQVRVEDLINVLRKAVGQDHVGEATASGAASDTPTWFDTAKIKGELDARPMLAAGEHPVAQVMADLKEMAPGGLYKLTAPFIPAPLMDKAASLGFAHHLEKLDDDSFAVYFCKPE